MPHILFTGHLFYFLFLKPVLSPKASVTSFISNMLICLLKQYSKCKMKLTARVQLYFFIWLGTKNLKARETAQIPPPPLSPRSSSPNPDIKAKKNITTHRDSQKHDFGNVLQLVWKLGLLAASVDTSDLMTLLIWSVIGALRCLQTRCLENKTGLFKLKRNSIFYEAQPSNLNHVVHFINLLS